MYQNGIQSYRKTNVFTSNPVKLVILCYEGAIDNLKIAKNKFMANDFEAKYGALKKTQNIIDELLCSLDFEKGGAVARNLESLYNYMSRKIIYADVNQDMNAIDEVIDILSQLLDAWESIVANSGKRIPPQTINPHYGPGSQDSTAMSF